MLCVGGPVPSTHISPTIQQGQNTYESCPRAHYYTVTLFSQHPPSIPNHPLLTHCLTRSHTAHFLFCLTFNLCHILYAAPMQPTACFQSHLAEWWVARISLALYMVVHTFSLGSAMSIKTKPCIGSGFYSCALLPPLFYTCFAIT